MGIWTGSPDGILANEHTPTTLRPHSDRSHGLYDRRDDDGLDNRHRRQHTRLVVMIRHDTRLAGEQTDRPAPRHASPRHSRLVPHRHSPATTDSRTTDWTTDTVVSTRDLSSRPDTTHDLLANRRTGQHHDTPVLVTPDLSLTDTVRTRTSTGLNSNVDEAPLQRRLSHDMGTRYQLPKITNSSSTTAGQLLIHYCRHQLPQLQPLSSTTVLS